MTTGIADLPAPRALIFDFDGLIVDSEAVAAQVVIEYLATHGAIVEMAELSHLFGGTGPENEQLWMEFLGLTLGEVDMAVVGPHLDQLIFDAGSNTTLLPGVAELIAAARAAGWPCAIGTGRERFRLLPELDRLGLADAFDVIVTAEDVPRGKPAPDIFLRVAGLLGLAPADCIVLEDSLPGCQAALAAGMSVVACPSAATQGIVFPDRAAQVESLAAVTLEWLSALV